MRFTVIVNSKRSRVDDVDFYEPSIESSSSMAAGKSLYIYIPANIVLDERSNDCVIVAPVKKGKERPTKRKNDHRADNLKTQTVAANPHMMNYLCWIVIENSFRRGPVVREGSSMALKP